MAWLDKEKAAVVKAWNALSSRCGEDQVIKFHTRECMRAVLQMAIEEADSWAGSQPPVREEIFTEIATYVDDLA